MAPRCLLYGLASLLLVDTTRVTLCDVDESMQGSDYINANYIKVSGGGCGPDQGGRRKVRPQYIYLSFMFLGYSFAIKLSYNSFQKSKHKHF